MGKLQEMLKDSDDLALHGIPFALAQIFNLLRDVLAIEAVVAGAQAAQHLGLVLGPGVEIVVVAGSVRHSGKPSKLAESIPDYVGSGASSAAVALAAARRVMRRIGTQASSRKTASTTKLSVAPHQSAITPMIGGMTIAASRFIVWRRPTTEPWRYGPTAFACTENIIGCTTPCSQPRANWARNSSAKMPPRNGVAQMNRIDNTVPLSIVFCGSPNRIARPANSEPKPLAISIAANRMPIEVPVSPMPSR